MELQVLTLLNIKLGTNTSVFIVKTSVEPSVAQQLSQEVQRLNNMKVEYTFLLDTGLSRTQLTNYCIGIRYCCLVDGRSFRPSASKTKFIPF